MCSLYELNLNVFIDKVLVPSKNKYLDEYFRKY